MRRADGFTPWDGAAHRTDGGYPMGFTLMEVLVASIIVAILVAGALRALQGSSRFASRFVHEAEAIKTAQKLLEGLKEDVWPASVTGGPLTLQQGLGKLPPGTHDFTSTSQLKNLFEGRMTYDVENLTGPGGGQLKKVTVKVDWDEAK